MSFHLRFPLSRLRIEWTRFFLSFLFFSSWIDLKRDRAIFEKLFRQLIFIFDFYTRFFFIIP